MYISPRHQPPFNKIDPAYCLFQSTSFIALIGASSVERKTTLNVSLNKLQGLEISLFEAISYIVLRRLEGRKRHSNEWRLQPSNPKGTI